MRPFETARGPGRLVGIAFVVALGCWAAGVTLPVLHVTELFVFENEISLVGIVDGLMQEGEYAVGILVLIFTLMLPPAKLAVGYCVWRFTTVDGKAARRGVMLLDAIGKWAMLDVLILALVIVTLKSSWVADVQTAQGLYYFAASAILALLAGVGLRRTVTRNGG